MREITPPSLDILRNYGKTRTYLEQSDKFLERIGYTEHGFRHADIVAKHSKDILLKLKFSERTAELAAIAGLFHDIGNILGRGNHGTAGALIAQDIMTETGFPLEEIARVMCAIGNHEDEGGDISDEITAALIIADKTDVHRSRVRNENFISFDIHDRVNFAVTESTLDINPQNHTITLRLTIDTKISQVMEYFEIFLSRMVLCRKAAQFLHCTFSLVMNDVKVL